jgi:hypothetical protein
VPHLLLPQLRIGQMRLSTQVPVSGKQEEQIVSVPMLLAHFEQSLFAGDIIASVTVDKYQPAKPVLNKILQKAAQQIEIRSRWRRQRAGKIKMMIGVPEPASSK